MACLHTKLFKMNFFTPPEPRCAVGAEPCGSAACTGGGLVTEVGGGGACNPIFRTLGSLCTSRIDWNGIRTPEKSF